MKRIAVLGSTGSIGTSTLRVARHLSDSIKITALAVHSNIALLEEQILEFRPEVVAVFDEGKAKELKDRGLGVTVLSGEEGVKALAAHESVDLVMVAIVGIQALSPTISAIQSHKEVALANKEVLVAAGELISQLAKKNDVSLIPVDSEHSAIFQCLQSMEKNEIRRVILTASGGPFYKRSLEELAKVSLKEALLHPTWSMGAKVTVDSSTLMNKGLEVIEARWLFDLSPNQLDVVIHPQSIIHSFVECIDGCILAEMSEPSMVFPIQYALTYPKRREGIFPPFDFFKNPRLEFFPPDTMKFPSLNLAFDALSTGGSSLCYLNAANEVLVERFLKEEIKWISILQKLEKLMSAHKVCSIHAVEDVFCVDQEARAEAREI